MMSMPRRALLLAAMLPTVYSLANGAALTPPLGWQSWNALHMKFNATLFLEMAAAMADPNEPTVFLGIGEAGAPCLLRDSCTELNVL